MTTQPEERRFEELNADGPLLDPNATIRSIDAAARLRWLQGFTETANEEGLPPDQLQRPQRPTFARFLHQYVHTDTSQRNKPGEPKRFRTMDPTAVEHALDRYYTQVPEPLPGTGATDFSNREREEFQAPYREVFAYNIRGLRELRLLATLEEHFIESNNLEAASATQDIMTAYGMRLYDLQIAAGHHDYGRRPIDATHSQPQYVDNTPPNPYTNY